MKMNYLLSNLISDLRRLILTENYWHQLTLLFICFFNVIFFAQEIIAAAAWDLSPDKSFDKSLSFEWNVRSLPHGSTLYKGEPLNNEIITDALVFHPSSFYASTIKTAEIYGNIIDKYMTSRELILIDIGNVSNLCQLCTMAQESNSSHSSNDIAGSFGINCASCHKQDDLYIIRVSELDSDRNIANSICNVPGIDGYYASPLPKNSGGSDFFHEEFMICNRNDKVTKVESFFSERRPPSPPCIRPSEPTLQWELVDDDFKL
ncbi:MAG: hypothetical protein HQK53_14990 [Oligoflexia bacterium]|nr:hypothetical protein [Oligoflexia bacterium]